MHMTIPAGISVVSMPVAELLTYAGCTASLRVNFLRPFFAGETSRYVGSPMRVGRPTYS
jgi:acyl-coenzyme A thioesterase PaaI-like protein